MNLSLDGPVAGVRVLADRERVREIVRILLENAVEHAGVGVQVRVAVHPGPERVAVVVSDNGRGLPEGSPEGLFKRFGGRGTGLGLAIARRNGGLRTWDGQMR